MMPQTTMHIEGLATALRGLDSVGMRRICSVAVDVVSHDAKIRMASYPPETEANQPKPYPGRWYQRLWGPRWRTASGALSGKNTSERLQYSWRQSVLSPLSQVVDTLSPRTGRPVSYAPWVVGEDTQTEAHRQHGWQTTETVAHDMEQDSALEARIMAAIDRLLA